MARKPLGYKTASWIGEGLMNTLAKLSDNELKALGTLPKWVTRMNCWYVVFQIAPHLAEFAKEELHTRRDRKKRNLKEAA